MTDNNLESDQVAGNAGITTPDVSQTSGAKPTSTLDAAQLLEQLRTAIKEEVGKAVQSTKDKRFSEIEKTLGGFQPVLERFKDIVSPEQLQKVQHDLEWDEMKRRVLGQSGETVSAGTTPPPAVDAAKIIRDDYKLDMNDPKVALLAAGRYASAQDVELALARHFKELRTAPSPTPAQAAAPVGGTVTKEGLTPDEIEEKSAKLTLLYRQPTEKKKEIEALEKELQPYWT